MLPRYKTALFRLLSEHDTIARNSSIKAAQALYALHSAPPFAHKEGLVSTKRNDTSLKGKAMREFIVEFENINQYALRHSYSLIPILRGDATFKGKILEKFIKLRERFQSIYRKNVPKQSLDAIVLFKSRVYQQLSNFPIDYANAEEKNLFVTQILHELKDIKSNVPAKRYKKLYHLITLFLQENVVCHPDLAQYRDETETFNRGPKIIKTYEQSIRTINTAKTGHDIAEILYHLSEKERKHAYNKFPKELHKVIIDANQLGDVLRFLPVRHIEKILTNKDMKNLVKNVDDLNSIRDKMFYPEQKKIINRILRNNAIIMQQAFKKKLNMLKKLLRSSLIKNPFL